ncbi:hypothetical protein BGX24_007278 [Mortierella sp. AD032]|nr:hypothetical protein BGX24_007278 [Mortierella sp. AD032]
MAWPIPAKRSSSTATVATKVYENSQTKSVRSGLVLTAESLDHGAGFAQEPSKGSETQTYECSDFTVSDTEDDVLVIGVTSKSEGTVVTLVCRDNDNSKQMRRSLSL